MSRMDKLPGLHERVIACERCPRLRDYCKEVASVRRRAFMEWKYWGRPVPGFGDPNASLWIIGLAPAAHGANRTGRVFTGDKSGDFLYAALHRAGYANQSTSLSINDGLRLKDCYISASVRCAPPANKPLPEESERCSKFIDEEWDLLTKKRAILALGKIAWDATIGMVRRKGLVVPSHVAFAHGAEIPIVKGPMIIGSYHVSQQNTFTGVLTPKMFDHILKRCQDCRRD